jgi:4a-hydroxytetrahydrobiopterin dehydratase
VEQALSRPGASEAVSDLGWRFLLGTVRTSIKIDSLNRGAELAQTIIGACGPGTDRHLRLDLRPERLVLTLQSAQHAAVTDRDVELAKKITGAVRAVGADTTPEINADALRSVQIIEIAIDALDIASIRPFWKAILGYTDEAGADGPQDPLIDPVGQAPSIWFQQMDRPRPQRNRIHLDICVPHDEAQRRVATAVEAGGRLVSADRAPAFVVLADAEGNEACVTTWQGRD